MDYRERILALIKLRGPMQPFAISKELATNSTLASAMLSEMSDKELLRVSSIKVGSSPLYYMPGQEDQLVRFTGGLNEKDKVTLELLQQEKVLRDNTQDPLTRVSLRVLKDFAKQLDVQHEQGSEVFWKWYLLSDKEVEPIIRKLLESEIKLPSPTSLPEARIPEAAIPIQPAPQVYTPQVSSSFSEKQANAPMPVLIKEQSVAPKRKARQQSLSQTIETQPALSPSPEKSSAQPIFTPIFTTDHFSTRVQQFLSASDVKVVRGSQIKKGEYSLVIQFPTSIGVLSFVCIAKDKKTISDTDISSAYVQAQHRHLPLLYLATGDISKSAKLLMQTALPGVVFKKI